MGFLTIHQLPAAAPLTGAEEVPIQSGPDTLRTTTQAIANLVVVVPAVVPIGLPIIGGTSGAVLFIDAAGRLQQAPANFSYDGTTLIVTTASGAVAKLGNGGTAGQFIDSVGDIVEVCNGESHVTYDAASPGNWLGGSSPQDVWVALDRIAAAFTANGLILP